MLSRPGFLILIATAFCACNDAKETATVNTDFKEALQQLTDAMTDAEKNDSLEQYLSFYSNNTISMPEYQLTLTGMEELKPYYSEIFRRQKINSLQKKSTEFISMDSTIVESGIFQKEYSAAGEADTLIKQNGKYWHIWKMESDGSYKLKGEANGFFHQVENPEFLVVDIHKPQPDEKELLNQRDIPFELKAYNALIEKGVRNRDGKLRAGIYTNDGSFMPFAEQTVSGMKNITTYLQEYSSRGNVIIDSIQCYTYYYEYHGDFILEYPFFKVKWTSNGFSGKTEGKGIRIWKRQPDHSLRLYREIGTHNHLN